MKSWKFRGYDLIGNKWVYGDLTHNQKVTKTGLEPRTMVGGYEVAPESVGIWTGRCDDKEIPIYQGDIISVSLQGHHLFNATIKWYDSICGLLMDEGGNCCSPIPRNGVVVIGNVYERDNPRSEQDKLLDKKLVECDLSIRALLVCKANDIETLRDLTQISKDEFLRFRNCGKVTFTQVDDLLKSFGLDWKQKL